MAVVRSTTIRPTGTISAPPTPCAARAASKMRGVFARPQAIELSVKMRMAVVKTARAPNRSTSHALGRMRTAIVSE